MNIILAASTLSVVADLQTYLRGKGYTTVCAHDTRTVRDILLHGKTDCVIVAGSAGDRVIDELPSLLDIGTYAGPVILIGDPPQSLDGEPGGRIRLLAPGNLTSVSQALADLSMQDDSLPSDLAGIISASDADTPAQGRSAFASDISFGGFIGTSPVMQTLYEQIQSAARSQAAVFITGESGTGKEICAQAIHKYSARSSGPFVPLNCAAIPRELLESELFGHARGAFTGAVSDRDGAAQQAGGGTLFLDEIGEMDPQMQTKLLRFLQDGTYQRIGDGQLRYANVRIVCATNRDPAEEVRAGRFREDLFYRLHVLPVSMPPLRQRGHDVIDIAQTLLLRFSAEEGKRFRGFSAEAEALLLRCRWPGNIRQLQNIIRHTVVMHDAITVTTAMLPPDIAAAPGHPASPARDRPLRLGDLDGSFQAPDADMSADKILPLHEIERLVIVRAIQMCGGNIPRAASLLQISPSTIYRKKAEWDRADLLIGPVEPGENDHIQ